MARSPSVPGPSGSIDSRPRLVAPTDARQSTLFVLTAVLVGDVVLAVALRTRGLLSLLLALVPLPLVAVLGLALLRRPQRGVLVLAALLPFDGLHQLVPFPPGWKEALVVLTLTATFVAPPEARGTPGRKPPSWWVPTAGLLALALTSAVAVSATRGLVGLKIGFFYVLVAVIVWRCPFSARERDRLVTILMVAGFVTAVIGVVQQVLGPERLVELGWEYNTNVRFAGGYLRSFSTFDTNFGFALFLMMVVLVGVPSALHDLRRPRNVLFLLVLPVLGMALAFTVTRAAWLGLTVGLGYLAITRLPPLRTVLVHGIVLGTVALLVAGGYSSAFLSQASSDERFDLWRQNVGQLADHPLGVGVGASGSAAEKVQELTGGGDEVFQPDNYYFKTALELGVLGLWLLLVLLVTAFAAAHVAGGDSSGADAALASGVAALVLATAAVSTVATYLEVFPMDAYFWLLLGVVAACERESR
jgi:hypothetical protein